MTGWKFSLPARAVLALGITTDYTHVKVYEKDGYLYVDGYYQWLGDDGGRLDEHLPGLFSPPPEGVLIFVAPSLDGITTESRKLIMIMTGILT
jgi:hypothetical protein